MRILCILFIINVAASLEVNDLDVKHIADVITHTQEEVFKYKRPKNAYEYKAINQTVTEFGRFDYIIVGAGSTGAVLATRLSENENVTILLLEAGGEESTFSDIPAMMMHLHGTKFNWNFKSVPQTTCCLGMQEHICMHPRGKGLGGTSILNAAMYVRGNKDDFDSWAKSGNKGWSYDEILPYFIKSENSQIDGDPGYHGKGGLLNVEYRKPVSPISKAFLEANIELGRRVVDYNGKEQLGVALTQFSTINGQRGSTGKSFLARARKRRNLTVLKHSYAKKVAIGEEKEAHGVVFDREGQAYFASASKDVILSAGAFGSPQLLFSSGIGPSNALKRLGIPVVKDLPVGENYQDHPAIFALLFTTNYTEPIKTLFEYSKDYLEGLGPFTVGANAQAIGFLRTKSATTPIGVPNIEAIIVPQNASNNYFQKAFNYNNETYNTYWPKIDDTKTFAVFLMLLHPKSIGSVTPSSSNPYDYPKIHLNFLSDKGNEDIQAMYEGVSMLEEMLDTRAFRALNAKLYYSPVPGCSSHEYRSKEQWYCQIRHLTTHIFHPVGTCKMAPYEEKGVVDHRLKVYGVDKLRVADASVIPQSPSGHINAPAIMIGEKLADMLLKE